MKIGFAGDAVDRETGAAGLGHVDMHRHLAQAAVDDELLKEFRMIEQGLPMSHEHRHEAGINGVAHNGNQLALAIASPVGVGHVAARDLQTGSRTLEAAVGVDLFLHLREGRDRDLVGVFRQIAMRAMEGAIARSGGEAAVREMAAADLIRRLQSCGQRVPARPEEALFFFVYGMAKRVPAFAPERRHRIDMQRMGEVRVEVHIPFCPLQSRSVPQVWDAETKLSSLGPPSLKLRRDIFRETKNGGKGIRTPDIQLAKLALYQLSYAPLREGGL